MLLLDNLKIPSCNLVRTYLDCPKYSPPFSKINSRSPFPPEVFLDAGSHGGHEVVEVHDDVYAHVEEPAEGGVSATNKPENGCFSVHRVQPLQIFAHCKLKIIKF